MNFPAAIPRASLKPAQQTLAGLLIAASVLADAALERAAGESAIGGPSLAATILFLALVTSQATAVAIWTALAAGSTARRLSVGISAVAGLTWLTIQANRAGHAGPLWWSLFVVVLAGEVLAMFAAGRALGLRLTLSDEEATGPSSRPKRPLQYSISDICAVTAAIGVLAAVLREALWAIARTAKFGAIAAPSAGELLLVSLVSAIVLLPVLGIVPLIAWTSLRVRAVACRNDSSSPTSFLWRS